MFVVVIISLYSFRDMSLRLHPCRFVSCVLCSQLAPVPKPAPAAVPEPVAEEEEKDEIDKTIDEVHCVVRVLIGFDWVCVVVWCGRNLMGCAVACCFCWYFVLFCL